MLALIAATLSSLVLLNPGIPPEARTPRLNPESPATAYVNGLWYWSDTQGVRFALGDRYSIAGVFTAEKPAKIEQTVDLKQAFVVPPFGEAHNHSVDAPWTLETARRYLRQGIFYYKNPNDIAELTAAGRPLFNKPDGLDVTFSHGGLSIAGGHPEGLYRYLAPRLRLDPEKLDGRAFFATPTPEELERRWPEILRGRPDFIKLYLLDAEGQGKGKPSGLSPPTFRRAVTLAAEAGLRTVVHVETAADIALAVDAGASEAAHLPGYDWAEGLDAGDYRIGEDIAKRMVARGFVVSTTTSVTEDRPTTSPEQADRKRKIQSLQAENLKLLHGLGVTLAIGTDSYSKTALDEAMHLNQLGAFTPSELLKFWVETGPRSVFPRRAIGRFEPGYEASFVTLDGDPTQDFSRVKAIRQLVKQGVALSLE